MVARAQVRRPDSILTGRNIGGRRGAQPRRADQKPWGIDPSQFDTQYALIANAGLMRCLTEPDRALPGNGFALENRSNAPYEPVGLGRAWAWAPSSPSPSEAAVRIVYEVFPETRPTGKDEATAVREDVKVSSAHAPLSLELSG